MGVKNTMNMFFAAMNEQVAPTRGNGSKIVSTPMGPFGWNDQLQTWVNVNNGMQMNNIAFQDMYAMMDYNSIGGSKDNVGTPPAVVTINTLNFSPTTQNIGSLDGNVALTPTFTISGNTVPVALKWNIITGDLLGGVVSYKKNGGVLTTWTQNTSTGAVTFSAGDTLQMFIDASGALASTSATVRLFNVTNANAICSNTVTINLVAQA